MASGMERICLGRISLEVPEDRVIRSRTDILTGVAIEVLEGVPREREQTIRAEKANFLHAGSTEGSLLASESDEGDLWIGRYRLHAIKKEPSGVRALLFHENAMIRFDARSDPSNLAEAEAKIAQIARTLSPGKETRTGAYCVGGSLVATAAYTGAQEHSRTGFDLRDIGMLRITTRTNGSEMSERLTDSTAKARDTMTATFGIRPKLTQLADVRNFWMDGDALQIDGLDDGGYLQWRAPGRPNHPQQPFVEITLMPTVDAPDAQPLLSQVVGSIVTLEPVR